MSDKPRQLPVKRPIVTPAALRALQRGDLPGVVAAMVPADTLATLPQPARDALDAMATIALELRRENVAAIGGHEAFVRRTSSGSLQQVIRPVVLSLADKTLYQIVKNMPYRAGTDELIPWKLLDGTPKREVEWRPTPADPTKPNTAELTMPGYLRLNAVAGCAVANPPTVMVDGEPRTNPYVDRGIRPGGVLGDIRRIVVAVIVAGPAPATGNPVVVNYVLDYDPAKDLQHMLGEVADKHPQDCYLVDEESGYEAKPGWKFVPLYGGAGYYFDLRNAEILGCYRDFTNLLQNALKKAQTVARRNAMRQHPALATSSVEMDANKRAVVPVIGWASSDQSADQYMRLCEALARGQEVPADVERVFIDVEQYDAERDGGAMGGALDDERASVRAPASGTASTSQEERNRLIAQIDDVVASLDPAEVATLGYGTPETLSTEALRDILTRANETALRNR